MTRPCTISSPFVAHCLSVGFTTQNQKSKILESDVNMCTRVLKMHNHVSEPQVGIMRLNCAGMGCSNRAKAVYI